MKITDVTKSMTYYVDTDKEDLPYYRTDENGHHWENLISDTWVPVFSQDEEKELQKLFWEYKMRMTKLNLLNAYSTLLLCWLLSIILNFIPN